MISMQVGVLSCAAIHFPMEKQISVHREGNVLRAVCLRCGFSAASPKRALLERVMQDHTCRNPAPPKKSK